MRRSKAFTFALTISLGACSGASDPGVGDDAGDDQPLQDAMPDAGPPLDILRINEVAAAGNPEDWFEIVNVTNAAVELSEYCFSDDPADAAKCKPFPAMSLAPNTHYALDVSTEMGTLSLGGDEELHLFRIADMRLSNSVDWDAGASPANESYARIPDIIGDFARTNMPTKAAANVADDPTAPLLTLLINEVADDEAPDWLEVVNASGAPIDLSLYCFADSGVVCAPLAATTTMLAPGAYYAADVPSVVPNNFGFSNGESAVVRRIADNRISDSLDWPADSARPAGTSYARFPNTTGTFMTTMNDTKGTANPATP